MRIGGSGKHVKRFKLNVLAKKLPVAAADQLQARFGYFRKTLTDAASEWFDALVLANIADMQTFYDQMQTFYDPFKSFISFSTKPTSFSEVDQTGKKRQELITRTR